jgi:alkanesulfonate monooxygenase SsuD/methylene tetrahydromethanopterin reductase-like flavin-dependent oxidoreductase (luciferase family)
MKVSLFMMPLHAKEKPFSQQLSEDAEAFLLADLLGYHEAWCGEHYSSQTEAISSPLMFFASLLPRTKQIKFCTGVACLPQYHPAVYAGHAALFDHLSGGRFIFGIGAGGLLSDLELFKTADKNRPEMLREAIDMIITLWTTDPPYDIKGKYWTTEIRHRHLPDLGVGYFLKPLQKPHPPIALTASSVNSGSMKAAGLRGWIPVTANFIGAWQAKTHWEVYQKAAESAGHLASRDNWRIARSIHVGDTDAEAEAFVMAKNSPFDHYYSYLFDLWSRDGAQGGYLPSPDVKAADVDYTALLDSYVIRGSAETVTRRILEFREEVGHFGHLLVASHDWTDKEKMRRSMQLVADRVLPSVNNAIGAMATSAGRGQ